MGKAYQISVEATFVLKYLVQRGGCGVDIFETAHVRELIQRGYVERVAIGCDEPQVYVTPGGYRIGGRQQTRPND